MNKIYIQDNGRRGMIVVVAQSIEQARELMNAYPNYAYYEPETIQEYEIKEGFSFANVGDM